MSKEDVLEVEGKVLEALPDVYKRQAQGRAFRINKKTSHITIKLQEKE